MMESNTRWTVKVDAFRPTTGFNDLLKIVASYYEMYSKAAGFIGPWIAKQGTMFLVPSKEQVNDALGKDRPSISFRARSAFIDSLITFVSQNRGKRTLITPNPSTHHSAQFPYGSFSITQVEDHPRLWDGQPRKSVRSIHMIELAGANEPIYVENLQLSPEQIQFIIIRPKLGKLGTANISRWEVLMYKKNHGYLIDHVDSVLNPRYSGIM